MFKPNSLYYSDGYKVGHKRMLAKGTKRLYGTWIPRHLKHAPKGIKKIVSAGQQLTMRWLHDEFKENFFEQPLDVAVRFSKDMSLYLGMEYDGEHFEKLHKLGYLPIKVKSLPEGVETYPNVPHMTFINTHDDFAWLTLYLETVISSLAWKTATSATIALQYKRNAIEWVMKTDPSNLWLVDYMCHDFSARGLDPFTMIASGLGHAMSHRGSDTLMVIPAARYFYDEPEDSVAINSVNASEHSVSTTKIFTVGEKQMIIDWLKEFDKGILSIVADTFDLYKLLLEYVSAPEVKELILARDGKLVIRPDSGDPVDIICGLNKKPGTWSKEENGKYYYSKDGLDIVNNNDWEIGVGPYKGVIEILWDTFGGTINEQGYKVLDPHIGAIYGDSITLERQISIYERLATKGFAATNIVLGVGSFTYQYNSRDTFGYAAKGGWFEVEEVSDNGEKVRVSYDIYKDPVTDDGSKKSPKGLISVLYDDFMELRASDQQDWKGEERSELQVIYEDGEFFNKTTLTEIRERLNKLI